MKPQMERELEGGKLRVRLTKCLRGHYVITTEAKVLMKGRAVPKESGLTHRLQGSSMDPGEEEVLGREGRLLWELQ